MDSITDSILVFIAVFPIIYQVLHTFEIRGNWRKEIEAKAMTMAEQQSKLSQLTSKKKSQSIKAEHAEFWSSPDFRHGMMNKIKLAMEKANITSVSVYSFILLFILVGSLFSAIVVHFKLLDAAIGVPVTMGVWYCVVHCVLFYLINARKMEFLKLFPDAIEIMIRGCKAGLNIMHIMKLVSEESKDPVASEFKVISQRFDMGIEPRKVLLIASEKIGLEEFQFLVVALVLQMENGGALAEILQNLSGVVRRRLEFELRLKALSAEAKMSAIIISALPFVFVGVMAIINPNHLKEFGTPGIGQTLFRIAVALFCVGTVVMWRIAQIKV